MSYHCVQFIIDVQGEKQAAIMPIDMYRELQALRNACEQTANTTQKELYRFAANGAIAQGYPIGAIHKPQFHVLAGSSVNLEGAHSLRAAVCQLRHELVQKHILLLDGNYCFFAKDYIFNSPSLAASLIAGNNRSGLDAWTNAQGFSLKQSGYGRVRTSNEVP